MVVSNWMPGSADCQAAVAMRSHNSRAGTVFAVAPSVRRVSRHGRSARAARMKPSLTRTVLLAFWPETVR